MASKDFTSANDGGNARAASVQQGEHMVAQTELKAGALRLPEVLMQSVTTIAPAIAALFFTPAVVGFAGITSPLAYPIAFVITLLLGIVLVQFTKKMPAAGGYYTYISRSIHPRVGWLVAWLFILYSPTVAGIVSFYMGNILRQEILTSWNLDWPWFTEAFIVVGVV